MSDDLYTVPEVASMFACSKNTVQRLMKNGELTYVKIGKSVRFRREDLEECIRTHRHHETRNDGVQVFG